MTEVKICGLMRHDDIQYVNECHPDMAGFIMAPGFRRTLNMETAEQLVQELETDITPVGVFLDQGINDVLGIVKTCGFKAIQLHGSESPEYISELKDDSGLTVIKSFKMSDEQDIGSIENSPADLVLLDGGCGEGKGFDWTLIGNIRRRYILAGGLDPDNVGNAIRTLQPFAVDTSSGVETDGIKDKNKIKRFVQAARAVAIE